MKNPLDCGILNTCNLEGFLCIVNGQENPYKENVFESKEYQNFPLAGLVNRHDSEELRDVRRLAEHRLCERWGIIFPPREA